MKRLLSLMCVSLMLAPSVMHAQTADVEAMYQGLPGVFIQQSQPWTSTEGSLHFSFSSNDTTLSLEGTPTLVMNVTADVQDMYLRMPFTLSYKDNSNKGMTIEGILDVKRVNGSMFATLESTTLTPLDGTTEDDTAMFSMFIEVFEKNWVMVTQAPEDQRINDAQLQTIFANRLRFYGNAPGLFGKGTVIAENDTERTEQVQFDQNAVQNMLRVVAGNYSGDVSQEAAAFLSSVTALVTYNKSTNAITHVVVMTSSTVAMHVQVEMYPQEHRGLASLRGTTEDTDLVAQITWNGSQMQIDASAQEMHATGTPGSLELHVTGATASSQAMPALQLPQKDESNILGSSNAYCQPAVQYTDVCYHWSRDYMNAGKELGIVQGKSTNNLDPDTSISRAEMVTLLMRAYNYDTAGHSMSGGDLRTEDWFNAAWATAFENGVVKGYGNGIYDPYRPVTRAEAAKMLLKARMHGEETTLESQWVSNYNLGYSDVSGADWFAPYVQYLSVNGIANGFNGQFRPYQPITRAEAVKMIITDLQYGPDPQSLTASDL